MDLEKCLCGQSPAYELIGIDSDEYEKIECPECQRSVMVKREDWPDAESLWFFLAKGYSWGS